MFLVTDSLSDCTNIYEVSLRGKKYTIGEFIQEVFTERPNEWGNIEVNDIKEDKTKKEIYDLDAGERTVMFKDGKIIGQNFDNELLNKPIRHVIAQGGWSRMDYVIYV